VAQIDPSFCREGKAIFTEWFEYFFVKDLYENYRIAGRSFAKESIS